MGFNEIWNNTLIFLYQLFTLGLDKISFGNLLGISFQSDTTYYVLLIGIWIVIFAFVWFMLWLVFRVIKVVC